MRRVVAAIFTQDKAAMRRALLRYMRALQLDNEKRETECQLAAGRRVSWLGVCMRRVSASSTNNDGLCRLTYV